MLRKNLWVFLLLAGLSACNFPTRDNPGDPTQQMQRFQTQVALTSSPQAGGGLFSDPFGQTTPTPPGEAIPNTGQPVVRVSVATNCRSGPSPDYTLLGVLREGESAIVVGKNEAINYWVIENPAQPGSTCWLWGEYATIEGDVSSIPEVESPIPAP